MNNPVLQVEVVEHRDWPGAWVVEAIEFEHDGAIEQAIFSGPNAQDRARAHAQAAYGIATLRALKETQHDR